MPPKCSSKRKRTGTSGSSQSKGRSAKSRRRGSTSDPSTVQGESHEDTKANKVADPLTTDANSSSNWPLMRNDILIIVQEVVKHLQPAACQESTSQPQLTPGMCVIIMVFPVGVRAQ